MKSLIFAAALMMGSAAVAQMAPPAPADAGAATMPADPAAPPPADSGASMPPPAAPNTMATHPAAPMASAAAPGPQASYPRCSKMVTDQCRQGSGRESDTMGGKPAHRHSRHK
ncbi:hypothetical protein [Sphingomonas sp.]|uniref:hypothetical protein n=1 Tax=Sphingomonas sp. TaxID=28214 RepID=UPI0025F751C3|nr:hypothetical protein [Sphingomonas sp.]